MYRVNPEEFLSPHFQLKEFLRSRTAEEYGLPNPITPTQKFCLQQLCKLVLEPLRLYMGEPIIVTSGQRSIELNQALRGRWNSQHLKGQAADLRIGSHERGMKMFVYIRDHLDFDQVIFERSKTGSSWLHVSCKQHPEENRHEALPDYHAPIY